MRGGCRRGSPSGCAGGGTAPAVHAQAGAVPGAAPGEVRGDLEPADLVPVDLVVIAAVGVQIPGRRSGWPRLPRIGGTAWTSGISWVTSLRLPPVVIAASEVPCASTIRWCLLPALPRSTGKGPVAGPPFIARMWLESTAAREKSSRSAARSSDSGSSCRRCHTPASFQSRSCRQQVIPEPKPGSWGRNSQRITVYSTNRIPHSTLRLSRRLRSGRRGLRGTTGSSGSIRAHNSSSISHGLAAARLDWLAPLRPASMRTDTPSSRRSRNLLLLGVVRRQGRGLPWRSVCSIWGRSQRARISLGDGHDGQVVLASHVDGCCFQSARDGSGV